MKLNHESGTVTSELRTTGTVARNIVFLNHERILTLVMQGFA